MTCCLGAQNVGFHGGRGESVILDYLLNQKHEDKQFGPTCDGLRFRWPEKLGSASATRQRGFERPTVDATRLL
jgi:hypothetical protein